MGQKYVGGCALVLGMLFARYSAAQGEGNPIAAPQGGASAGAAATGERPTASSKPSPGDAVRRIEAVLDQPLQTPIEATARPLNDVLTITAQDYDIPILFDTAALDAVAVTPDVEVNLQIANVSLRSALELILKAAAPELTYIIDKEVLLITTAEEAGQRLEVKVYRVDDLIFPDDSPWRYSADSDSLIDLIAATVEHDSWTQNGTGEGEIYPYAPGMLVIAQTHDVHEQIDRLLDEMRAAKAAIESERKAASDAGERRPVTRAFWLGDEDATSPENRERLKAALQASVDWDTEGDLGTDGVFLDVFKNRVLVRHLPRVVRQVELVVHEIDPSNHLAPGMGDSSGAGERDKPAGQRGGGLGGRGGGF